VATREAYGFGIVKLGEADQRVVALDADVGNSTFSDKFEKAFPRSVLSKLHRRTGHDRLGDGSGGARRHSVPVHVRVLPGARGRLHPDGGDQQRRDQDGGLASPACRSARTVRRRWRLEDLAMCRAEPNLTVLYPCDAVSTERLVALAGVPPGSGVHRTSRPKTEVIYYGGRHVHDRWPQGAATERQRSGHGCRRRRDLCSKR
jgi:transketolase